ncbi:MAG: hypothetical protein HY868_19010 [Chloroflexi bacterium]|nr:hypothetical protein [Chloroflexota bacterium]
MALGIQQIPPTLELHRQALEWANRIHQVVAYDAAYLALAESLDAEFWTTAARLAESARKAGAKWAHGLDIQSSRSG